MQVTVYNFREYDEKVYLRDFETFDKTENKFGIKLPIDCGSIQESYRHCG